MMMAFLYLNSTRHRLSYLFQFSEKVLGVKKKKKTTANENIQ